MRGTSSMTGSRCKGEGGGGRYMGRTPTKFGATGWGDSNAGTKEVKDTKREKETRTTKTKKEDQTKRSEKKKAKIFTKSPRGGLNWRPSQKAIEPALWTIEGPLF